MICSLFSRFAVVYAVLFLSIANSSGQTFYRTYASGNDLAGASIIPAPDGNLLVGGGKDDSAFVMKIDPLGEVIWTVAFRSLSATTPLYVTSMEITPDNFLIGTGVGLAPSNLYPGDGFYFKMSLAGSLVYCNAIEGLGYRFTMRKMLPLNASSYLIVAAHEEQAGSWYDPTVLRVDALTGTITSQSPRYDFENLYLDDISESVLSPDKAHVYSTGRLYINGASPDQMRIFLSKFDTLGSLLWTKFFNYSTTGTARLYGSNIVYENDTLVVANFGDNTGTSSAFEVGLLKADTDGNMIWAKNYDITSTSYERSFRLLKMNYGYAIVGVCTAGSNDHFVLALNHQGDVLWSKSYGTPANEDHVNSFGSLPATRFGNDIFFTGLRADGAGSELVVARIDVSGDLSCLTPGILNVVTTNNPIYTEQRVVTSFLDPVNFTPVDVVSVPPIASCEGYELNLGNDTSFCTGSLVLDANTLGAIYQWQDGSTNATFEVTTAGTYFVTVTVDCCLLRDSLNVSAAGSVFTNQVLNYCSGDTAVVNGVEYFSSAVHTDTVVSSNGCDSIVTVEVTFEDLPNPVVNAPDSVCSNTPITLSATGASSYVWSPDAGLSCSSCASTVLVPAEDISYVVTGFTPGGCSASDTVAITVLPSPEINIPVPEFSLCQIGVLLTVIGDTSYLYSWSPDEIINDPTSPSPTVFPSQPTTYSVTATDINGCAVSASIPVDYYPGSIVAIPNAFSPNGDGLNDEYKVIFHCPITLDYFRIYNRWGQLLFETDKSTAGWDGVYKMKQCEIGVYAYVVSGALMDGERFFLKGNVTLLR